MYAKEITNVKQGFTNLLLWGRLALFNSHCIFTRGIACISHLKTKVSPSGTFWYLGCVENSKSIAEIKKY